MITLGKAGALFQHEYLDPMVVLVLGDKQIFITPEELADCLNARFGPEMENRQREERERTLARIEAMG